MKTDMEKLIYFSLMFYVIYRRTKRGQVACISDEDGIFEYFEEHIAPMIHRTPEGAAKVQCEED